MKLQDIRLMPRPPPTVLVRRLPKEWIEDNNYWQPKFQLLMQEKQAEYRSLQQFEEEHGRFDGTDPGMLSLQNQMKNITWVLSSFERHGKQSCNIYAW